MVFSFATGVVEDVAFSFATGVPDDVASFVTGVPENVAFSFATGVPEDAVLPLMGGGSAVHMPAALFCDFEGTADDSPGAVSGTGP